MYIYNTSHGLVVWGWYVWVRQFFGLKLRPSTGTLAKGFDGFREGVTQLSQSDGVPVLRMCLEPGRLLCPQDEDIFFRALLRSRLLYLSAGFLPAGISCKGAALLAAGLQQNDFLLELDLHANVRATGFVRD